MKPCRKCGSTNRNQRGRCRPCDAARSRRWYHAHKASGQATRRDWYHANKEQVNAQSKAWGEQHPERRAEVNLRSRLKKYGLTIEQYRDLLERQQGLCLICEKSLSGRAHIDHDHGSGIIRGILCHSCNVGLGHFRDSPDLLRAAAAYLEGTPALLVVLAKPSRFKVGDGRFKVSDEVRARIAHLRGQGLSLAAVARHVGLSRSWVQVVVKRGLC